VGDSEVASIERLDQSAPPNMIWIPGGTFRMGSDKH
jgi:formylglycine-generating enzyme required for sulfatase activity